MSNMFCILEFVFLYLDDLFLGLGFLLGLFLLLFELLQLEGEVWGGFFPSGPSIFKSLSPAPIRFVLAMK
jgi:hypothetical protein